jgi:hypothetical protein
LCLRHLFCGTVEVGFDRAASLCTPERCRDEGRLVELAPAVLGFLGTVVTVWINRPRTTVEMKGIKISGPPARVAASLERALKERWSNGPASLGSIGISELPIRITCRPTGRAFCLRTAFGLRAIYKQINFKPV